MHLGLRIKIARISKGLTQEELAEKINKTRPLISSIEQTGKANYYTLRKICDVLGLELDETTNQVNDPQAPYGSNKNAKQMELVKQLEKDVQQLQQLVQSQADLILALKEKIVALEKKAKKKS
ncbi:MAG: helix-turn-helix domain-containing protein [Bacteroidota bacterium]